MLNSTSKFEVVEVIYKRPESPTVGFAIATGYWEGQRDRLATACRWYNDGIGYPQTFGKPQWMLLPVDAFSVDDLLKLPEHRTAEVRFSQL